MRLGFVTSNPGKARELAAAIAPHTVEQVPIAYPEVQAATLEDVVEFALTWLARRRPGKALLIDDAGLFINALDGFPGVYSRYVYDTLGPSGLLKQMEGVRNRQATFRCVLGLLLPDGSRHLFHGACAGRLTTELRGDEGFGYDPIFIPKRHRRTFAEMSLTAKNRISHRGRAVAALAEWLSNTGI